MRQLFRRLLTERLRHWLSWRLRRPRLSRAKAAPRLRVFVFEKRQSTGGCIGSGLGRAALVTSLSAWTEAWTGTTVLQASVSGSSADYSNASAVPTAPAGQPLPTATVTSSIEETDTFEAATPQSGSAADFDRFFAASALAPASAGGATFTRNSLTGDMGCVLAAGAGGAGLAVSHGSRASTSTPESAPPAAPSAPPPAAQQPPAAASSSPSKRQPVGAPQLNPQHQSKPKLPKLPKPHRSTSTHLPSLHSRPGTPSQSHTVTPPIDLLPSQLSPSAADPQPRLFAPAVPTVASPIGPVSQAVISTTAFSAAASQPTTNTTIVATTAPASSSTPNTVTDSQGDQTTTAQSTSGDQVNQPAQSNSGSLAPNTQTNATDTGAATTAPGGTTTQSTTLSSPVSETSAPVPDATPVTTADGADGQPTEAGPPTGARATQQSGSTAAAPQTNTEATPDAPTSSLFGATAGKTSATDELAPLLNTNVLAVRPAVTPVASPDPQPMDTGGPITVYFAPGSYAITEDSSPGFIIIDVWLSQASSQTVTVQYASSDGTATAGEDYRATSGTLSFAPGSTSSGFLFYALDDETMNEPGGELAYLSLSNPQGAVLGTPSTATVDIAEGTADDDGPYLDFSAATYSVNELGGQATITVNAPNHDNWPQTLTVQYQTADGTAQAGVDYTATSGTLTFPPGVNSQTFTVPILDDHQEGEGDQTVDLSLSNPTNAYLSDPFLATLTISEDNEGPTVEFSAASYSAGELGGSTTITAVLSQASDQTVTVNYATADGTAQAGVDYTATSGTLTFPPGTTSESFTVPILDDNQDGEANQALNLTLSDPSNAELGTPSAATLTISEDDELAGGGGAFVALEGVEFNGTVADFQPPAGLSASDYGAQILWGDGSQSSGQLVNGAAGEIDVVGTHTYTEENPYPVAVQLSDTSGSTAVLLSLGLVLSLDDDRFLQSVADSSLSFQASASQSGTDGGGSFDLTDTGTLSYVLTDELNVPDGTQDSQTQATLSFSVTAQGSDAAGDFALGGYSLGYGSSATASTQSTSDDLATSSTLTGTDSTTATVSEQGDGTSGSYTLSGTTVDTATATGSGVDDTGSFQITSQDTSTGTSVEEQGDFSGYTRTLTEAVSQSSTTTGDDLAQHYSRDVAHTANNTWLESGNLSADTFSITGNGTSTDSATSWLGDDAGTGTSSFDTGTNMTRTVTGSDVSSALA